MEIIYFFEEAFFPFFFFFGLGLPFTDAAIML